MQESAKGRGPTISAFTSKARWERAKQFGAMGPKDSKMRSNAMKTCAMGAMLFCGIVGSADAGFVDNFQVTETNGPVAFAAIGSSNQVYTTLLDTTACLWSGRLNTAQNKGTSTSSGNGTMAVTLGQASLTFSGNGERRGNVNLNYAYGGGEIEDQWHDLTGISNFTIGVNDYTGGATTWTLKVGSTDTVNTFYSSLALSSSAITNGVLTFNVADMTVPSNFDWQMVTEIDLTVIRTSLGTAGSTTSFTLSNFQYTVPAPGAVALLGAAGLVGGRRRRA